MQSAMLLSHALRCPGVESILPGLAASVGLLGLGRHGVHTAAGNGQNILQQPVAAASRSKVTRTADSARLRVVGTPSTRLRGFAAQPALAEETDMFCFQCEQTQDNKGCTTIGVCGKTPTVAGLQDLLMYSLKGLGSWAHLARQHGITDFKIDSFINNAIFSTLTNVNFDESRFVTMLHQSAELQSQLQQALAAKGVQAGALPSPIDLGWDGSMPHPMAWKHPGDSVEQLRADSKKVGVAARREALGATLAGAQELVVYGLKGLAAYAHHAEALGATSPEVFGFVQETLHFLATPGAKDLNAVLGYAFRIGEVNFKVMEMLSNAHKTTFGTPTPTQVSLDPVPGKCILVTGHDMHDLHLLLQQTEGKGINVYTHGEMLPAHGYPGLKKYKHLVGQFGGAWYRQKMDFSQFPGAVLATTNCVLDPPKSYKNNLFTVNATGLAGVRHIGPDKDFSPVIQRALQLEGFTDENMPDPEEVAEERAEEGRLGQVTVGFGHDAVLGVAGQVVDAVKTGKLEHIFLIGGCDGSEPQRKYYANLAKAMPTNTMVLTLGCGKYRIFDQDFGLLPGTGLPRLLDMGQCNDAYSALVVATELAKAFNTDVNGLPLSLDISWFEQKAVAVLLTLLHLGVQNIRLGPRLPAFLTPDAVNLLVQQFKLKAADTEDPEADLKRMMASQ